MSLADAASRGSAITVVVQLVRVVVQFGTTLILARLLTPEQFGLVAMVLAVVGFAEIIRDFGLSSAAIQAESLSIAERNQLFWVNTAIGVACTVIAVAAAPLVGALYGDATLTTITMVLSVVFTVNGLSTQYTADLTRRMKFRDLGIADLAPQVAGAATAIALAALGFGIWALVAQQIVVAVLGLIARAFFARWLPTRPNRSTSIRRFVSYGVGLFGTRTVAYVSQNIDTVLLGVAWGPAPVGYYGRAYQLLMLPLNQISTPLTRVALPVLSRLNKEPARYLSYLKNAQTVGMYVTATVFAAAAALSVPLVNVLFGDGWEQVAPIFAALAIGGIFRALSQISYWIFLSRALTSTQFVFNLFGQALIVIGVIIGLAGGPVGVAIGTSVGYACYWVLSIIWSCRAAGLPAWPFFGQCLRSLSLITIPVGAVAYLVGSLISNDWLALVAGTGSALAYVALVTVIVPPVRRDYLVLANFARRAIKRRSAD